jgi:hypothetical protein
MSEEKKYRKAIEQLAKDGSTLLFNNTGVEHASAVVSTILKTAQKEVLIYAQNMNGDISKNGDYISSLSKFLVFGKTMKVLVDNIPETESEAFSLLKVFSSFNDGVSIRIANQEFKDNLTTEYKLPYHFCVGDDRMIRIETDPSMHKAICSFNNVNHATKLKGIFNSHFNSCETIQ